jgi:hypothetical protein
MMKETGLESESAKHNELMARLGIKHALADVFVYREYRYGKLDDAVAQAKRDQQTAIAYREKRP